MADSEDPQNPESVESEEISGDEDPKAVLRSHTQKCLKTIDVHIRRAKVMEQMAIQEIENIKEQWRAIPAGNAELLRLNCVLDIYKNLEKQIKECLAIFKGNRLYFEDQLARDVKDEIENLNKDFAEQMGQIGSSDPLNLRDIEIEDEIARANKELQTAQFHKLKVAQSEIENAAQNLEGAHNTIERLQERARLQAKESGGIPKEADADSKKIAEKKVGQSCDTKQIPSTSTSSKENKTEATQMAKSIGPVEQELTEKLVSAVDVSGKVQQESTSEIADLKSEVSEKFQAGAADVSESMGVAKCPHSAEDTATKSTRKDETTPESSKCARGHMIMKQEEAKASSADDKEPAIDAPAAESAAVGGCSERPIAGIEIKEKLGEELDAGIKVGDPEIDVPDKEDAVADDRWVKEILEEQMNPQLQALEPADVSARETGGREDKGTTPHGSK